MKAAAVRSRVPEELEERASAPDAERSLDSSAMTNAELEPVHLTQREREVLALLCEGLPNKLIARRLNISAGTVKVHISNILRALGVSTRLQAVLFAREYGLGAEASVDALRPHQHSRRASHR
jgi:DNA-binding NarL/FixJ family response regulator